MTRGKTQPEIKDASALKILYHCTKDDVIEALGLISAEEVNFFPEDEPTEIKFNIEEQTYNLDLKEFWPFLFEVKKCQKNLEDESSQENLKFREAVVKGDARLNIITIIPDIDSSDIHFRALDNAVRELVEYLERHSEGSSRKKTKPSGSVILGSVTAGDGTAIKIESKSVKSEGLSGR